MRVQRDGRRFTVDVVADGEGLVSHAGAALLAEAADRVGLTEALSRALEPMRERRGRHDPGRVVRDLAVMLADGGDCLADLRAVRDQQVLFGPVASDATAFRVLDAIARESRATHLVALDWGFWLCVKTNLERVGWKVTPVFSEQDHLYRIEQPAARRSR